MIGVNVEGGRSIAENSYERLQDDGLTQWHPAFLQLGVTLDLCAAIYRKFCQQYRPQAKPPRKNNWGSQLLSQIREKVKAKKVSPGQQTLWDEWQKDAEEIHEVAKKFVLANCFDPKVAEIQFHSPLQINSEEIIIKGYCGGAR